MEKPAYIKLFLDYLEAVEPLGDAERGRLFTSLLEYARTGAAPQLGGNERFLFPMMKAQIDRDFNALEELSESRSQAGKQGGRPKKQKKQKLSEKPNAFLESKKSKDKDEDEDEDKDEDKKEKIPTESKRKRFANPELQRALEGFIDMRRAIKKPLTDRALEMILTQLDKLSSGVTDKDRYKAEALNQSVLNNWAGVFEVRDFTDSRKIDSDPDGMEEAYQVYLEEHSGVPFSERLTMSEFYEKWTDSHD